VRRTGLTAAQKTRLALYDNRTAELADWDADVIADLMANERAMLDGLFADSELANLIRNQTSELQVERRENVLEKSESFYSEVHGRTVQLILSTEDYWKMIKLLEDYCTEQKLENFPAAIFHLFEQNAKLTT